MKIHLKPAPGRRVRDPATGLPLPAEGALVQPGPFWNRRLEDDDVVLVTRTAKKTKEV